jgi:MFS family permease
VRVLVGVILTGLLSVLDSTLVVPLLATIGDDFNAGSEVSWLIAGYLLASTVSIPLWGRWMDLRGERNSMWAALLVFTAGTAIAMLAPSLPLLILGRLIQGVGAGGLVPLGQAIVAARCTGEERARLQVYYNVAYGTSAGLGPLIGGALIGVSWRWAFAAILPVIVISGMLMWGKLSSRPRESETRRFDALGSILITVGLTLLLLGIERSWWGSLVVGALALLAFGWHVRRRKDGLIPASLFRSTTIVAAASVALVIGFVQFAMLTFLPLLAQDVAPGLNSGIVVVPLTLLWLTLGAFTGMLALRIGTKPLALLSVILAVGASVSLVISAQYPSLLLASVLVGASAGLILIPALLLSQHAAPREDVGAATSFMILMRNFGGAAGAAVVAVLLENRGVTVAFGTLTIVACAALLPALLLPSRKAEKRILAAVEGGSRD